MGTNTTIPWAHHTFNPWWGCVKIRPGCANCYAEKLDNRFGSHWGRYERRRFFGGSHWGEPRAWNRKAEKAGERHRVFCGSMCDVFEQLLVGHPDRETMHGARLRLFSLILETPNLDWFLLTKRAENISDMLPSQYLPNVWLGVTAENQAAADEQIPILLSVPASVRFVSYEPAIGPIDFGPFLSVAADRGRDGAMNLGVDWLIAGAESGHGARLMDEGWMRSARDQCVWSKTPFFYKQRIEDGRKIEMPELDGRTWAEFPK